MRKTAAASAFLALFAGAAFQPAFAASSGWVTGEGASVRLVLDSVPQADGSLRGALDIALDPGWKTYWRDPGSAGVPPSLDVSGSPALAGAELLYPAPERHDDGTGAWSGYASSFALPVVFTLREAGASGPIAANVFLGVCRDICVPFSATLSVDSSAPADPDDAFTVEAAFKALPGAASAAFGVGAVRREGEALVLDAAVPPTANAAPALFLAAPEGYSFGVPTPSGKEASWRFRAPLLASPAAAGSAPLFYTLVSGSLAVSGTVTLP